MLVVQDHRRTLKESYALPKYPYFQSNYLLGYEIRFRRKLPKGGPKSLLCFDAKPRKIDVLENNSTMS